jgi:hypothetical protein
LVLSNMLFFILQYLNYATTNRQEWEEKGAAVVAAMVEKCKLEYSDASVSMNSRKNSIGSKQTIPPKVLNLKQLKNESGKSVDEKAKVEPVKKEKPHDEIEKTESKTSNDSMGTGQNLEEATTTSDNKDTRTLRNDSTGKKNEEEMISV